jgi:hypothetical protein
MVAMVVLLESCCPGDAFGAPQQFHSRKAISRCQGDFDAMHHSIAPAMQHVAKM